MKIGDFIKMSIDEDAIERAELAFPLLAFEDCLEKAAESIMSSLHKIHSLGIGIAENFIIESVSQSIEGISRDINSTKEHLRKLKEAISKNPDSFRKYSGCGNLEIDGMESKISYWCKRIDKYADLANDSVFELASGNQWTCSNDDVKELKRLYNVLMEKSTGLIAQFYSECVVLGDKYNDFIPKTKNVRGEIIFNSARKQSVTDSDERKWLTNAQWNFAWNSNG